MNEAMNKMRGGLLQYHQLQMLPTHQMFQEQTMCKIYYSYDYCQWNAKACGFHNSKDLPETEWNIASLKKLHVKKKYY